MKSKIVLFIAFLIILSTSSLALTDEEIRQTLIGEQFTLEFKGVTYKWVYCPPQTNPNEISCALASPTGWVDSDVSPPRQVGIDQIEIVTLFDNLVNERIEALSLTIGLEDSGELCYQYPRAENKPNPCLEDESNKALSLIGQFQKLNYLEIQEYSVSSKASAQALYDQANGFKQIAELKKQYEESFVFTKKTEVRKEIPKIDQGKFIVEWDEIKGDLTFRFIDQDEAQDYQLFYKNKPLRSVSQPRREGKTISITLANHEFEQDTKENIQVVSDLANFVIRKEGTQPQHFKPSSIVNTNPVPTNSPVTRTDMNYGSQEDILEVRVTGKVAEIRDNEFWLNIGEYQYNDLKAINLGYPEEEGNVIVFKIFAPEVGFQNVRDALSKNEDALYTVTLVRKPSAFNEIGQEQGIRPTSISYDLPKPVFGGIIPIEEDPQKQVVDVRTQLRVETLSLVDPNQFMPAVETFCSDATINDLKNPSMVGIMQGLLTENQRYTGPPTQDVIVKRLIEQTTQDKNMQVTLAGIASAESDVNVNEGENSAGAKGLMQIKRGTASLPNFEIPYKSSFGNRCANPTAPTSGKCRLCIANSNCESGGDARAEPDIALEAAHWLLLDDRRVIQNCFRNVVQGKNIQLSEIELHKIMIGSYNQGATTICEGVRRAVDNIAVGSLSFENKVGYLTWEKVNEQLSSSEVKCYVPETLTWMTHHAPLFNVDALRLTTTREAVVEPTAEDPCNQECDGIIFDCDREACDEAAEDLGLNCQFTPTEAPIEFVFTFREARGICREVKGDWIEENRLASQRLVQLGAQFNTGGDCFNENGERVGPTTNINEMRNGQTLTVCEAGCANNPARPCKKSTVTLNPKILRDLIAIKEQGINFRVTSFTTGPHSGGSSHYQGNAVDLVPQQATQENYQKLRDAFRALNPQQGTGLIFCEDATGSSPLNIENCRPGSARGTTDHIHATINPTTQMSLNYNSPITTPVTPDVEENEETQTSTQTSPEQQVSLPDPVDRFPNIVVVSGEVYRYDTNQKKFISAPVVGEPGEPVRGNKYLGGQARAIYIKEVFPGGITIIYFETDIGGNVKSIPFEELVVVREGQQLDVFTFYQRPTNFIYYQSSI